MRSTRSTIAALSACAVLAGCSSAPVDGAPVVHIAEAAKPSPSRALDQVLPTVNELATILGTTGFMGQLVEGGAEMLLQGVRESEATPIDCVSAGYRLQKVVYQASPVRSVASQSWVGGRSERPVVLRLFRSGQVRHRRRRPGLLRGVSRQVAPLQRADAGAASTRARRGRVEQDHRRRRRQQGRVGGGFARRRFDDPACPRRGVGLRCGCGGYERRRQQRQRRGGCRRCRQSDAAEDRRFVSPRRAELAKIDG